MESIAAVSGGLMIDTNATAPSTWHSLGGVPMGETVDLYGRVLGHQGLYVLDGARIPGSTGACTRPTPSRRSPSTAWRPLSAGTSDASSDRPSERTLPGPVRGRAGPGSRAS